MSRSKRRRHRLAIGAFAVALVGTTMAGVTAGPASAGSKVARNDPGVGSVEAMKNPQCDPTVKRIRIQTYAAPLCVKAWKDGADNGGATAQGVTKDKILVVVLWNLLNPEQAGNRSGLYTNQATGQNDLDGAVNALIDQNEIYKYVYETWGREVEFKFVKSSGTDEAAQRADAVAVNALKPFAVIDAASRIGTPAVGGGPVFEQAVINGGVPYVSPAPATDPKEATRVYGLNTAEILGKYLKGGNAQFAGGDLKGKPRVYGVLYASNFNIDYFEQQLKKWGIKLAQKAEYTVPVNESVANAGTAGDVAEQLPTLVTKLKSAGVTTLVNFANNTATTNATKAMNSQDWFPEIVVTTYPYTDLDILARSFDQEVWSHAFGMIWFLPYVEGQTDVLSQTFQWFWGKDQGTRWQGASADLGGLYTRIHYAGPNLTKKAIEKPLPSGTAVGGYYSKSMSTFEAVTVPEGQITPRGSALGWWNPDVTGQANFNIGGEGKGAYMYLNNGQRYIAGKFPKAKQAWFDAAKSVQAFASLPTNEPKFPQYTCTGCPSSGNTSIVPAASQDLNL
jgi:hypothetical protein